MNASTSMPMLRRAICILAAGLLCSGLALCVAEEAAAQGASRQEAPAQQRPNLVILFADDLGYGDLSVYGHPTIRTPHLDRMAAEGMKFTQFYVGASVCTPSRAALLTGRLPVRSGMASDEQRVLFPDSKNGLPQREVTIAEALKEEGYATAAIGKWHLGHRTPYLPTSQGFDAYFGIPYSNDMDRSAEAVRAAVQASGDTTVSTDWQDHEDALYFAKPQIEFFDVPLLRDTAVIERPADQHTLNRRYAAEATRFIEAHQEEPFFLYFAHSSPHVPLFASDRFDGVSRRGLYGDVVEEIDWTVGQVMKALRETGQAENTLVVFTSDNGPWLTFGEQGGSAGLLRGGKGSTWEGGMREPMIAWWPGRIEAGTVTPAVSSTMDLFSTALELAGAEPPSDRIIDGQSLMPILEGKTHKGHEALFYYRGTRLYAVRVGPWKAHFITQAGYGDAPHPHDPPLLFHLAHDPSEQYDVADEHPEVLKEIQKAVEEHRANLKRGDDQLAERGAQYVRE